MTYAPSVGALAVQIALTGERRSMNGNRYTTEPRSRRILANVGIYLAVALAITLVTLPIGGVYVIAGALLYLPLFFIPFLAVVEILAVWLRGAHLRLAVFSLALIAWSINIATTENPEIGLIVIPATVAIAVFLRLPSSDSIRV